MTEQFGITIEAGPDVDSGCDVARIKAPSTPAADISSSLVLADHKLLHRGQIG